MNNQQIQVPNIFHQQVQEVAYYKWQEAGCPNGRDLEFWSSAEKELMGYRTDEQYEILKYKDWPIYISSKDLDEIRDWAVKNLENKISEEAYKSD